MQIRVRLNQIILSAESEDGSSADVAGPQWSEIGEKGKNFRNKILCQSTTH